MQRSILCLCLLWVLCGLPATARENFFSLETTPYPGHLVLKNNHLFFSDASDTPVKKIDLQDGRVVPLVRKMGTPVSFCVEDADLFWVALVSGNSGSCIGYQTVRVLHRTFGGSLQTIELARGDNCGAGTHDIIARGENLYWVTSTASPETYRIEKVSRTGGAPSVIYSLAWDSITALAADDTHLYWTEGRFPNPGVVKRMPLSGGSAEVIHEAGERPVSATLAVAGGRVFFADLGVPNAYRLLVVPVTGGTATVLVNRQITDPFMERKWITHIAVDGDNIVWSDQDSITRTPVSGGPSMLLAADLALPPYCLAAAGGRIYWSENTGSAHGLTGNIKSIPLSGGMVQVYIQSCDAPLQITVQDGHLYWNEGDIGTVDGFGRIARMPLAGGPATTLAAGVHTDHPPIAADDTHVYIADGWRIKKVPIHGGLPESLAATDFTVKDLAVDEGYLYWTEEPFTAVKRIALEGGTVTLLDTGSGPPGHLQVSGGFVYWMDHCDTLKRIPAGGGTRQILAAGLPYLDDFTVMGDDLYFAEHDTGTIKKMPVTGGSGFPLVSISAMTSPRRLAVDDSFLYWVDQQQVGKIPRAGGEVAIIAETLATDPSIANRISVEGGRICWSETGSGRIQTTGALSLDAMPYMPLTAGRSWTFQREWAPDLTYTVLPQAETVNGVPTRIIQHSDGYRQYFTNDANGLRLHQEYEPALDFGDGVIRSATFTFSNPLLYAKSTMTLGETVTSGGSALIQIYGLGNYNLSYSAQSTSEGSETLNLPLGRFKTGRARVTVHFFGNIGDGYLDETVTNVNWLARDIGPVQWTDSDGDANETGKLSGVNLALADLAVFQMADPLPLRLEKEFTYRIRVVNKGPDAAADVTLTDILPPSLVLVSASTGCAVSGETVTCDAGTLEKGESFTAVLTVRPTDGGTLANRVSAHGEQPDPWPDDNEAWRRDPVPEDSDGDGIPDRIEIDGCNDPTRVDTDGDGLDDGLEDANRNGVIDPGESDPCAADGDGDGLPDPWEIQYQTDPLLEDDAADPDDDGFTNLDEYVSGTDPQNAECRPLADLDGDRRTTLADAILALRTLSENDVGSSLRQDYTASGTDINGDGRAGLEETLYVIRQVSRMQQP